MKFLYRAAVVEYAERWFMDDGNLTKVNGLKSYLREQPMHNRFHRIIKDWLCPKSILYILSAFIALAGAII